MPVKVSIKEPSGTYFITFTCVNWLPLIKLTNAYDAVYKWFDILVKSGHHISGYVVMPNHVHALISFRNTGQSINTIVGNGKRFMAYEIIKRLEAKGETSVLTNLQLAVKANDRLKNKKHEVWKYSFDWKECHTNQFMEQKLNYMHLNPCKGKWNLSNTPEEYEHSSAKFYFGFAQYKYICGMQGVYPITNYLELADIDFK